jgi:hypothetical protein
MSLQSLCTDTIVIVHPAFVTDRYGDTTKDYGAAIRTTTKGWMAHGATNEIEGNRETDVSIWRLYIVNPFISITAQDRVEFDGSIFEVQGKPIKAKKPSGVHHIEAILRLVEG